MKETIIILLFTFTVIHSQENLNTDPWQPLQYFLGDWKGESSGKAGDGKGTRTYDFVMEDNYVYCRNIMEFKPQKNNPQGEIHEDWGMFSFDKTRSKIVFRQFNVEGFFNQFTVDSVSAD